MTQLKIQSNKKKIRRFTLIISQVIINKFNNNLLKFNINNKLIINNNTICNK